MEKSLTECVAEVKEDLALHTGYELNDEQCDELRLTGRVGIDADKFLPCLKWALRFIQDSGDDIIWTVCFNAVTNDFEITLKGYLLVLP